MNFLKRKKFFIYLKIEMQVLYLHAQMLKLFEKYAHRTEQKCENQGMYKNRVKNDRNFFEIPTLLSCERGNPAENGAGKFKIYMLF